MPSLIVLNGPPACGKSTMARRYADEHPLTLNLDIDRLRDLIGGWERDPQSAGRLARAAALAAARAHLEAGHDVVVPQYLGRVEFLEQLASLAAAVGAGFREIVLWDTKENALRRFAERSRAVADPAHAAAQRLLDRSGGAAELAAMHDRLAVLVAARPVTVVSSVAGEPDLTYRRLVEALASDD